MSTTTETQRIVTDIGKEDESPASCFCYIDDDSIVAPLRAVKAGYDHLDQSCKSSGQSFNVDKTKVLCPRLEPTDDKEDILRQIVDGRNIKPENIILHPDDSHTTTPEDYGITMLGAPVSTAQEFKRKFLQTKIDNCREDVRKLIENVTNRQELFALLKYCFTQKFTYLLRTVHPSVTRQLVDQMDDMSKTIFAQAVGTRKEDIADISWDIARLHAADGGMGVYFLEDRIDSAYVASTIGALQVMIDKVPELRIIVDDQLLEEETNGYFNLDCTDKSYAHIPQTLKELLESISELRTKGVQIDKEPLTLKRLMDIPADKHKHLQAFLSDQLRKPRLEEIKKKMNPEQLAIFEAGESSSAGCWTDIIPSNDIHMQMSNAQFIHAARRRIIHDDEADAGQLCGCTQRTQIDHHYVHKMNCAWAAGKGRINTHDDLKFDLAALFTSVGLTVQCEQRLWKKTAQSEERMDLIVRTGGAPGMTHAIYDMDLTLVNAMTSRTTLSSSKTNIKTILNEAVTKKQKKYAQKSELIGHKFMALAFFVQGNWHKDFTDLFKLVIRLSGESERSSYAVYWRRRLSATIQKGVSNHLINSSLRINKRHHNFIQQMDSNWI